MKTTTSKKTHPRVPVALEGLIDRHGRLTARGCEALDRGIDAALSVLECDEEDNDAFTLLYAVHAACDVRFHPHLFAFLGERMNRLSAAEKAV